MDPHSRAPKKNTSHGNEVLPQGTTLVMQRPCYQRGSPCQDLAGNWTTRRHPDDRKETQTAVVWSCLPFIRTGQNHLARHSERGKKTRQTEEEVRRQHQGMDRPGLRQVPEGNGEQGKIEKTGCKIICGAPATLAVKRLMMRMIMSQSTWQRDEKMRNLMWHLPPPPPTQYTSFCFCILCVFAVRFLFLSDSFLPLLVRTTDVLGWSLDLTI